MAYLKILILWTSLLQCLSGQLTNLCELLLALLMWGSILSNHFNNSFRHINLSGILLENFGIFFLLVGSGEFVWLENWSGDIHGIWISNVCFQSTLMNFMWLKLIFLWFNIQLGPKFMKENGLKHVTFSTADGALEAAPAVRLLCESFLGYMFYETLELNMSM